MLVKSLSVTVSSPLANIAPPSRPVQLSEKELLSTVRGPPVDIAPPYDFKDKSDPAGAVFVVLLPLNTELEIVLSPYSIHIAPPFSLAVLLKNSALPILNVSVV